MDMIRTAISRTSWSVCRLSPPAVLRNCYRIDGRQRAQATNGMKDVIKVWLYLAASVLWAKGIYDLAPKTTFWLITGLVGSFALLILGLVIVLRTRYPKLFGK